MGKPRAFTTMPVRAIADTRLTALDLRVLMVISLHDGMSLAKGSGGGCYAKLATLAGLARTDITNLSKSANRLLKFDYLTREAQLTDKRRFTLRVIFGDDDSWRSDQLSGTAEPGEIVGETTNKAAETVGHSTDNRAEIVGDSDHENGGISKENAAHYTSLSEELNSVETSEIDSVETAQRALRAARDDEVVWPEYPPLNASDATRGGSANPLGKVLPFEVKRDRAEARLGSGVSIIARLTSAFVKLTPQVQLQRFEEELSHFGGHVDQLPEREQQIWSDFLVDLSETLTGPSRHHANRLWEEVTFIEEQAAR